MINDRMTNTTGAQQTSLSSDKLLLIFECIADSRIPMRLQDLAEQSGMSQSTVLRYLRALQNANYVYQDSDTSRYALTWKLCRLTKNLDSYSGLRMIANPFLNELAVTSCMGVCLVVNHDSQSLYLDCIDHPHPQYKPLQYIGKHAPLHTTGSGKLLLSVYNEAQLNAYIDNPGLKQYTKYTITQQGALIAELEKVRHQGFAEDIEECELGLRCLSYPLYDYNDSICAAISIFGNSDEMSDEKTLNTIHESLEKASKTISTRLGCGIL